MCTECWAFPALGVRPSVVTNPEVGGHHYGAYQKQSTRCTSQNLISITRPCPERGPTQCNTTNVELGGIQVDKNKYPALQRNAAQLKGNQRILPKPIVVRVTVNGHPARALLDSGSLGDFMSSTLADQLGVNRTLLETPLALQLAIQGSRSKVNAVATVQLEYQGVNESHTFDIINLNSYDLILGTPWMHQHQLCLGFNPAWVVIGSDEPQPLKMGMIPNSWCMHCQWRINVLLMRVKNSVAMLSPYVYAEPLCKEAGETDLPPFRVINHTIPLVDEHKTYPWREVFTLSH